MSLILWWVSKDSNKSHCLSKCPLLLCVQFKVAWIHRCDEYKTSIYQCQADRPHVVISRDRLHAGKSRKDHEENIGISVCDSSVKKWDTDIY